MPRDIATEDHLKLLYLMSVDRSVHQKIYGRRLPSWLMPKEPELHRKLAAILAADVVGYSRMMEVDEAGTLRRVQSVQKICMAPITADFGGRLVKTTGDGFLFEFSSAVDAILFAVAFQKRLRAAMVPVDEANRLFFRVGVHAGDVLSDGTDMFGDGVNVAARLETLCAPGGICMSAVVQQQLLGKIELPLVDLGDHQVKNITRAIHVFGIEADAIGDIDPSQLVGKGRQSPNRRFLIATALALIVALSAGGGLLVQRLSSWSRVTETQQAFSIAVLPFATLSNDTKPDDFADALVDNITTAISLELPSSTVISSESTFTYRGKNIDLKSVGRELDAKYLLEGSVQRFAERLRVNVRLIEAASATELWTDQFEGALSDMMVLQDQITAGIANTLQVQLTRIEADHQKGKANTSALDLVFRGESILYRPLSIQNFDLAEQLFRHALVLDQNNIVAMIDLANILQIRVGTSGADRDSIKTKAMLAEASQLLERARSQNPRYPALHDVLGQISMLRGRPAEAADQFSSEIEINRNASGAYQGLAGCFILLGRAAEAIPLLEKSIRLNPRDPHISFKHFDLMQAYFALADYSDAIAQGEQAYSEDPNDARLVYILTSAIALSGNLSEAKARLLEAQKLQPDLTFNQCIRDPGLNSTTALEMTARFCDGLRRAGLRE